MTLLCAPVKQLVVSSQVDLFELEHGSHKTLYDREGKPQYVDIDWKRELSFPLRTIVSYHNFEETPDLEEILSLLKKSHPNSHLYKIATYAQSTLDSLRMLHFLKRHRNVIGLCMGPKGVITRICAPIFQVPIAYAPLSAAEINAPGQLTATALETVYHFSSLNPETKIRGLIGTPVYQSLGHLFHNAEYRERKDNAVYVKMELEPGELHSFFSLARGLPLQGISVTAPLKEAILPFLDSIDPQAQSIGASNTVVFVKGKTIGYNTDGQAAVGALGDVENKTVVILGAGGAARSIAYSAKQSKARVVLVNRTLRKSQEIAQLLGVACSEKIPPHDILVNATSAPCPADPNEIIPKTTVMDISIATTPFLRQAHRKGCICIDGLPMYLQQALGQIRLFSAL